MTTWAGFITFTMQFNIQNFVSNYLIILLPHIHVHLASLTYVCMSFDENYNLVKYEYIKRYFDKNNKDYHETSLYTFISINRKQTNEIIPSNKEIK